MRLALLRQLAWRLLIREKFMVDTPPQPARTAVLTAKAVSKPTVLVGIVLSIPDPYREYVLLAWIAVALACTDLTPPAGHGRMQVVLMLAYRVLNFIACNWGAAANALTTLWISKGSGIRPPVVAGRAIIPSSSLARDSPPE